MPQQPRATSYTDAIRVSSDEGELPYQRPQLSNCFLLDTVAERALPWRGDQFCRDHASNLAEHLRELRSTAPGSA
jgi:hypothetical protein